MEDQIKEYRRMIAHYESAIQAVRVPGSIIWEGYIPQLQRQINYYNLEIQRIKLEQKLNQLYKQINESQKAL